MDERSTDRIERDIERTRADMSETIEALERKLSPGELFDELWGRVRGGETGSNVADTLRDHPIPLAMMGLGLGWLAIEKATESRTDQLRARYGDHGTGTYERAEGRVGPYRGDELDGPGATDRIRDAAGTVKDRVADLAGDAKDRLSSMGESVRDRTPSTGHATHDRAYGIGAGASGPDGASGSDHGSGAGIRDRAADLRDSAGREMHHARDAMQDRGRQVERGLQRMLDDYPLALGAVTFGLGLAAGLSVPSTPAEDRVMGDTADTLKGEVKRTARETAHTAKAVAGEAARAAKSEVDREGMGDDLRAKAERVIGAATETARTESENRGLTSEAMKGRAREIGEKTAETAKDQREGNARK